MSDTQPFNLQKIRENIIKKQMVLPNFQRGFKWKGANQKLLLESLILGYPIGALLLWKTNELGLAYRYFQDVHLSEDGDDDVETYSVESKQTEYHYVLDGQQRVTSIFHIFTDEVGFDGLSVEERKRKLHFFLDLIALGLPTKAADLDASYSLNPELAGKAILWKSYSEIRKHLKKDLNRQAARHDPDPHDIHELCGEYFWLPVQASLLKNVTDPLDQLLDLARAKMTGSIVEKRQLRTDAEKGQARAEAEAQQRKWKNWFLEEIHLRLLQTQVHALVVPHDDYEALARIFEVTNMAGMDLTLFDLFVARLGIWEEYDLRISLRDLMHNQTCMKIEPTLLAAFDDPKGLGKTLSQQVPRYFGLRLETPSMARKRILEAAPGDMRKNATDYLTELNDGLRFLKEELSVLSADLLPFADLISIFSALKKQHSPRLNRLKAYFWYTVFTVERESQTDSQSVNVFKWYSEFRNQNADSVVQALKDGFPNYDNVSINVGPVLYNGIMLFVLSQSGLDWALKPIRKLAWPGEIEDHHIFPKAWVDANGGGLWDCSKGQKQLLVNSVWNRVYVSKDANRVTVGAGAQNPAQYLRAGNFYTSEDCGKLCIPKSFTLGITQVTKEQFEKLLKERYDLIRTAIVDEVRRLIESQ